MPRKEDHQAFSNTNWDPDCTRIDLPTNDTVRHSCSEPGLVDKDADRFEPLDQKPLVLVTTRSHLNYIDTGPMSDDAVKFGRKISLHNRCDNLPQ
jgi:hypothetical protein